MKKIQKFLNFVLKKYIVLMVFLIILNMIFGSWYLMVLMEKVKGNECLNQLSKENSQLNADISRIKLEIDKQVDLANVKNRAVSELKMELITDVKYISVNN